MSNLTLPFSPGGGPTGLSADLHGLLAPGRTESWFAFSSISLLRLWANSVGPQLVSDQNEGDIRLVCYTAVFSVVMQRSSPLSGEERCVTTLKTAV